MWALLEAHRRLIIKPTNASNSAGVALLSFDEDPLVTPQAIIVVVISSIIICIIRIRVVSVHMILWGAVVRFRRGRAAVFRRGPAVDALSEPLLLISAVVTGIRTRESIE